MGTSGALRMGDGARIRAAAASGVQIAACCPTSAKQGQTEQSPVSSDEAWAAASPDISLKTAQPSAHASLTILKLPDRMIASIPAVCQRLEAPPQFARRTPCAESRGQPLTHRACAGAPVWRQTQSCGQRT